MSITRYDARASLENTLVKAKERFVAARNAGVEMPMYLDLYKDGRPYMTICAMPDEDGSVRRSITMISSFLSPDAESRILDSYSTEGPTDEVESDIARSHSGLSLQQRFQNGDPRVSESLMVSFTSAQGDAASAKIDYVRGFGSKTLFREAYHFEGWSMSGRVSDEIDATLGGMERDSNAPFSDILPTTIVLSFPGMKLNGQYVVPDDFIMTLHDHPDWAQAGDFEEWRRFDGGWIGQDSIWDDNLMIAPEPVLI